VNKTSEEVDRSSNLELDGELTFRLLSVLGKLPKPSIASQLR
jgi:hypothetical protein